MPRRSQAQLIHAKASAKAQLINAHQMGGGGGGSAPLVHAPTPTPRRDYTRFSPVTEVGGDKKKDKPTGVAIADNVDVGGKGRTVNDGSGLTQWRVGNKRFTQAEFDNIMERGMRGASLNAEQRAVFEASRKEYEEAQAEKKRLAEEKRVRDIKNADRIEEEKRQNAEWDRRQQVQREAALAEEQRRRGYAQEDFDRRQQAALDAKKREADAKTAERSARNRQYGLPDDYQATDADYKGLANRTHEYGYSPENQKRVDDFNAEIAKVREDTTLSPEQRDAAVADLQGRIDGIGKAVYKRPDAVAEPQMSTIKGDDGQEYRVWSPDGKSWQLFDKKDPEVKEPTMNGLTFKDYFGKFVGLKIPNPAYDAKAAEDNMDYDVSETLTLTPEQAMERARQSWRPDANVPAPTGSGLQLLSPGNLSHEGRPWKFYTDDSGKIAGYGTTRSTYTKTDDGNFAVIPTIVNGEELSLNDAVSHYKNTGEHWGVVRSESEAKMLAEQIHQKEQSLNQKAWNDYIHNNWDKISPSITGDKGMLDEHNRRTSYAAPQPEDIKNKWSQYAD